ncbi:MAG: toll/interleukin-1 receptor domain-containing protein [Thermosipho sp. (in: Bacteria)]|nr:toll/interleukin-1 receptor domain-containing protein [Thermosipho sp. (in: thermotogales)]
MGKIKIFISHASEDHGFVWKLAKKMRNDLSLVAEIFVDDWEIKVGDSIIEEINKAAENANFFVIVLSKHSINKEWVKAEMSVALSKLIQGKTKILPVWLEISEDEVPPILLPLKAAVFKSRTIIDETEYKKLIKPILDHKKAKSLLEFQENVLRNMQHLDMILGEKEPTREEVKFALDLIKHSPAYEKYFFNKLQSIKWFDVLKLEGFFRPEKAPSPEPADEEGYYKVPYWNVLTYLEKVSQQVNNPDNEKYIDGLIEIIRDVSEYHLNNDIKLDNFHIWSSFVRILSNIPNNKISSDVIELIKVWLDSKFNNTLQTMEIVEKLLPKFLTNGKEDIVKAQRIIEILFEVRNFDNNERKLLGDFYYVKKLVENYIKDIGEKCTINIIDILSCTIKKVISSKIDGTLYSFYDTNDFSTSDVIGLLSFFLRKVMLVKAKNEPEKLRQYLESFLKESQYIFPKIALFIIGQNVDEFRDIFFKSIESDNGTRIFKETLHWGDELRKTLEKLGKLSDYERTILDEKIKKACKEKISKFKDKNETERKKLEAACKQRIYRALSHDKYFKEFYEKMKRITQQDVELTSAIGKTKFVWGWGKSPLSVEEVIKMDNEKLVIYLSEFEKNKSSDEYTMEGLVEALKLAIKEKPEKFLRNLEQFVTVNDFYIDGILEGFKEAMKMNKNIDYFKILDFIEDYINQKKFPDVSKESEEKTIIKVNYEWILSSISTFIVEFLNNYSSNISEKLFNKVELIIRKMINKINCKVNNSETFDYVFYSLNTTCGHVIETYINFILKMSELLKNNIIKQNTYDFFKRNFISEFNKFLEEEIIEAYSLFGKHLFRLYYHLDKSFTEGVIKLLENEQGKQIWEAFMQNYLFYTTSLSNELYVLMKSHYEFSINYDFNVQTAREKLVKHVSFLYLIGVDSIKSPGLFYKLIEKFDSKDFEIIIRYFWSQRESLKNNSERNKKMRHRILDFWKCLYNKCENMKNDKNIKEKVLSSNMEKVLSNMVLLTVFLPSLGKPYVEWIKAFARYLNDEITFSFLLEYLEKFKDTNNKTEAAEAIGEIFLTILENFLPVYPENEIKSTVEYLYTMKAKNVADKICNIYAEHGCDFLKSVWEKYQNF